jgi:hypothetical protein
MARELAKATRPITERVHRSGMSLMRRTVGSNNLPTLPPIAEDLTEVESDETSNSACQKWPLLGARAGQIFAPLTNL